MNKPDDVSAEAWEIVADYHSWLVECWPATATKLPSVTLDRLARSLAAAIQSSVDEENEACALEALRWQDGIDAAEHIRRRLRKGA